MSSDLSIRVEGLGKAYTIRHQQNDHVTLAQVALERAKHPLRRHEREDFWALRDVSFEVNRGEVLGVIGRNGAGKSTLLKLLTRITGPSTGRIDLWGRVGSLLEVGTGFHPELTGRENIYLNGSILGMTRKEIEGQFEAIVDFAGVDRFLDTPVKRYSSGMYVRLAFAVAAHLETEILLVDEVLAVGDQDFQKKCLGKMHEVAKDGRTVLFVSHQLASVGELCDRAILLEAGQLSEIGTPEAIIALYTQVDRRRGRVVDPSSRRGTGEYRITSAEAGDGNFSCAEPKVFRCTIERARPFCPPPYVSGLVRNASQEIVAQMDSFLLGARAPDANRSDLELRIAQPWLPPGDYTVDLFLHLHGVVDAFHDALGFAVVGPLPYPHSGGDSSWDRAPILADFDITFLAGRPIDGPSRGETDQ